MSRPAKLMHIAEDDTEATPPPAAPTGAAVTGRELTKALAALEASLASASRREKELEQLNAWFNIALDNMARGLSMFDNEQRLIVCNKTYREIYDIPPELASPGTPLAALVRHHVMRETGEDGPETLQKQRDWIKRHVAELALGRSFTHTQHLKSGRIVLVTNQPLVEGGWVDIQEDITERRQAEERINWLARHDPLTELSNRLNFSEALQDAFQALVPGKGFALLWIDLDRFKEINDSFGHPIGDALLQSVSRRLQNTVRECDVVARLGGDEFAILQAGATDREEVSKLAQRIVCTISGTHCLLGHNVACGASVGVALAPAHGKSAEDLLKSADVALYLAKKSGRGVVAFFEEDTRRLRLPRCLPKTSLL